MILRLVYSFLSLSLVTVTHGFEVTKTTAKSPLRQEIPGGKNCMCQDQLDLKASHHLSSLLLSHTQTRTDTASPPNLEGRYGYPAHGLPSAKPTFAPYSTITPSHIGSATYDVDVIHENESPSYQVPRPIQIIEDQKRVIGKTICFTPRMVHRLVRAALEYVSEMPSDINRIIDQIDQELGSMPDGSLEDRTFKYPLLDPKSIFEMLYKPGSGGRTNIIFQYEPPSAQEPRCRETLERLIELAYLAYLELEEHPQCTEYLYKFATRQPDDRPTGYFDRPPGLQTLIVSILSQIDKNKRKPKPMPHDDRYGNIKPIKEPRPIKIPQIPNTNVPNQNIPPGREYPIPQYVIPQIPLYPPPGMEESEEIEFPETSPTNQDIIPRPLRPEETVNVLIQILKNDDNLNIRELFERIKIILKVNRHNIHPYVLRLLNLLLYGPKGNNDIPLRFIEILLYLLNSQRNQQWPWSDPITEEILSFLIPDPSGYIDPRILDIILNLIKIKPHEKQIEYILYILKIFKGRNLSPSILDIIIRLINSHKIKYMRPEYIDILMKLLRTNNGSDNPKVTDVVDDLLRWNEMGISPKQLDLLFDILRAFVNGQTDSKPLDILHILLTKSEHLSPKHLDFILIFLNPRRGPLDLRRVDIIHFLLSIFPRYPKHVIILLDLLIEDAPAVINSRFIDILIFLHSNRLLTPELLDVIVNLLRNEVIGQLEETQLKSLLILLAPYKQSNPKLVVDILTILSQGGLEGNLPDWITSPNNNFDLPTYGPPNLNVDALIKKIMDIKNKLTRPKASDEYRIPDRGYETPDNDIKAIIDWLHSQGLLNPGQGPNPDLVNNIIKILELGDRELGVVELTYMLKHMKPLIYHPVYYVKYRLPIMSFISNMKSLLLENPQLAADPMRLLQELILISNVTEVSPNLQGYPKEEILKLTFNDGDLVQAKILDEQNLSLNDQITYVQTLNSDITPEDLLELNELNEARYFPRVVQIEETIPEKIIIDKYVGISPVHYRQLPSSPITEQKRTIHTYIQRSKDEQDPPQNDNA